ncbi:winged helix DNA-binding protein, partial [Rhizobiaceae sp. 2RAB30]
MARRNQNEAASGKLDRTWHLARNPLEIDVAELEYALMRSFEAFGRWQAECLASVIDFAASGPENALLHIIRMNDRPKSIRDLAYMANREDIPNIQYSLRKLIKGGMVERSGSGRSGVTYEVTELGGDVIRFEPTYFKWMAFLT